MNNDYFEDQCTISTSNRIRRRAIWRLISRGLTVIARAKQGLLLSNPRTINPIFARLRMRLMVNRIHEKTLNKRTQHRFY